MTVLGFSSYYVFWVHMILIPSFWYLPKSMTVEGNDLYINRFYPNPFADQQLLELVQQVDNNGYAYTSKEED